MIEIRNLKKYMVDRLILDIKDLKIKEGKIYGLFGRNAVGKTTLINILSNKIFPNIGEILVNGQKFDSNFESNGIIYQVAVDNYFDQNNKVDKAFKLIAKINPYFDYKQAKKYADQFELDIYKEINTLSTGYQTVFKLCIGLAMDVEYIFYDEPTLGLDAVARDTFFRLLIENYAENEKTILISTHVIEEISSFIEEVIFLHEGDVLINENIEILKGKPENQELTLESIFINMTKGGSNNEKNI